MPTVTNPNLTLTESDGRVTIRVRADVTFSLFERRLGDLGQRWHPHLTVHDFDGGDSVGAQLYEFLNGTDRLASFVVTESTSQPIAIDEERIVNRSVLKGDAPDNDDELKVKIRIHTNDAQVAFTPDVLTDQEILAD